MANTRTFVDRVFDFYWARKGRFFVRAEKIDGVVANNPEEWIFKINHPYLTDVRLSKKEFPDLDYTKSAMVNAEIRMNAETGDLKNWNLSINGQPIIRDGKAVKSDRLRKMMMPQSVRGEAVNENRNTQSSDLYLTR